MISYAELARQILFGENLSDKLADTEVEWSTFHPIELPKLPGRAGKLCFSNERITFPKRGALNQADKKAQAIHSFANHELLAIEMMAAALLRYPHSDDESVRMKKGILTALRDEQKHLGLYISRLNELGYEFGDFALNDFFWRQTEKLTTPESYLAVMALTFEAANLDFAQYYAKVFREFGDIKTAEILELVLADELTHVALGGHWLKRWRGDKTLWDYYRTCLPWPLTPARSKGIGFDPQLHDRAVGDSDFLRELVKYDDDFQITRRSKE